MSAFLALVNGEGLVKTNAAFCAMLLLLIGRLVGHADTITTNWHWDSVSPRSVVGELNGTVITGATSESSTFAGIVENRFDLVAWQAGLRLPVGTPTVATSEVNAGDAQTFVFTQPLSSVLLYIENFDANSAARINVQSMGTLELVSASESISFESTLPNAGILRTSNATSNGEGDVVLRLSGRVDSVSIDYAAGDGFNGVFYTFAIPEPSAWTLLCCGFAAMAWARARRQ